MPLGATVFSVMALAKRVKIQHWACSVKVFFWFVVVATAASFLSNLTFACHAVILVEIL